ncbi:TPM domain-containing protein [Altericista sp. CCNU0014]|uniref:TPM domain-containing protein n=1 Tax=Altericista sp. CCNU0014 TaxID=3082949 RepID=UPI00384B5A6B
MKHPLVMRWIRASLVVAIVFGLWVLSPDAKAYNNPQLLPAEPTPVVDLAKVLTSLQRENLVKELEAFEAETGWRLRVLTQFEQTPGRAVIDFWKLDAKSTVLVADGKGGNILSFAVGNDFYPLLPRTFWIELQTRFGNQYFVRDNGEDRAIIQALASVEGCLRKGGCSVVPGLPQEQWILTLVTSAIGGIICGFAGRPRKAGQVFAWQWALLFSPLWGMLFFSFGLGPVLVRTQDWLPIFRNFAGFGIGFLGAFLSYFLTTPSTPEPEA